ncbi:PEPxxWA-CTERM sorting domain-containing protein [Phenylobacterium sp. SCN 70-31]|uniref:PEPxxWA-CTERM sorting domain-containing protein n=1 Tax=Phenylobacterium sp. SCN 70-31 TaxID=1660129 RepID=UPI00086BCA5A|nr:PEPxxWA-CTERM sorting domain-containing protein [Phenylobacterium sp. SCN 70-31]ODT86541.1 MAG: hypothetical protein ABS78_15610 [Phenylobacterium sp. SCN 70-31]
MTRSILTPVVGAILAAVLGGSAAAATRIVNFTLGADVASGEFSYDAALTGVIGYDDLATFSLTFFETGNAYDLSFVRSGDFSAYRGFSFDTASLTFITTAPGGATQIMSAIKNGFGEGFFVRDDAGGRGATDYADGRELAFDSLEITSRVVGAGVPEPATWALMIAGFGLAGASLRRRVSPGSVVGAA